MMYRGLVRYLKSKMGRLGSDIGALIGRLSGGVEVLFRNDQGRLIRLTKGVLIMQTRWKT